MTTIPLLDPSDFLSSDPTKKVKFVEELGDAFSNIGFVCVRNNLIPLSEIEQYYSSVKDFFDLPTDTKRKYEIDGLAGQRGYTSFGKEHAKGSFNPDLKEFWQIGQEIDLENNLQNVKVVEIANFNELGNKLYQGFEKTGSLLLQAIALYLGLEEDYFSAKINKGNSILRAIYYPPITVEPNNAIRSEAHEDINLITLLVGASAEGLQILSKEGNWLDILAPKDYIVINVGDMLQRLTNDKLRSTTHRVVNPPKSQWHTARYSIPFFLHPRSDMDLTCLASCVDKDDEPHYSPITAGKYLEERLIEIGLMKK